MANICPQCGHELPRSFGSAFDIKLAEGEHAEAVLANIMCLDSNAIEVKDDQKCSKTGNIAVEFSQSNGSGGSKPSGIAITKSKWWATRFSNSSWLIVTTEVMKRAAEAKKKKSGLVNMGDNGNKGVLLKLKEFVDWLRTT